MASRPSCSTVPTGRPLVMAGDVETAVEIAAKHGLAFVSSTEAARRPCGKRHRPSRYASAR